MKRTKFPFLGFGLGLRPDYYHELIEQSVAIDWLEITTENFLIPGGKPLYYLEQFKERYPIVMHGVSLSLGSSSPLDWSYLQEIKKLALYLQPPWISDHLCWTGVHHLNMHDLLPLPYTEESIQHVVSRIIQVQDFFQTRIAIENVSSYLTYTESTLTEWDFIAEILKRADCYLLLDVNNVYVSAINHCFNPLEYLNALPKDKIIQIHLAGHRNYGDYIIDTHDAPIIKPVWDLFAETIKRFGLISTMIERDDNMPPLIEMLQELNYARLIAEKAIQEIHTL